MNRILAYMKPYKIYLSIAIFSALVNVVANIAIPVFIGKAVDSIIGKGDVDYTGILSNIIIIVVLLVTNLLFSLLMTFFTNKITYLTVNDLREAVFEKINVLPIKYIDKKAHGELINTVVNDIDMISDGLLQGFAQLITGVITIVGTLAFMISINYKIAIIVVVLTPVSFLTASFVSKRTYRSFKEQTALRGQLSGYIEEMVGNTKLVKTFSMEDSSYEHFKEINERLRISGVKSQFYSSLTNPSTRFINNVIYAAVGIIGALNVIAGGAAAMTVGNLTSFLSYANQYMKPFNEISSVITQLQSALASAKRVFEVIDEPQEIEPEETEQIIEKIKPPYTICFNNVSFSYDDATAKNRRMIIRDFTLDVNDGEKIAIIGPTGSGKTTIINLLMRFYEIDTGVITINGVDIKSLTRSRLRSLFGMVLQDTWLFSGTIAQNIAYSTDDSSMEEIEQAAKAAYAHNFIMRLPDGYNTIVSEDTSAISAGQKQLLCIARVMLAKPQILILDEATSNIDTRTEARVQKAFDVLMENRTSFVVAHRLSTIKNATKIVDIGLIK